MGTPIDVAVIARDVHFRTEYVQQGAWLGGDPVATAVFNALSLTFPEGERLFIDAVRRFRGQVRGKLADDVRAFIAQEAIHSREHAALNAGLDCRRYPVEWIGESVRRRLAFLRRLGPMRMLGVTIALEHFTAMLAEMFDGYPELWAGTPPNSCGYGAGMLWKRRSTRRLHSTCSTWLRKTGARRGVTGSAPASWLS